MLRVSNVMWQCNSILRISFKTKIVIRLRVRRKRREKIGLERHKKKTQSTEAVSEEYKLHV